MKFSYREFRQWCIKNAKKTEEKESEIKEDVKIKEKIKRAS